MKRGLIIALLILIMILTSGFIVPEGYVGVVANRDQPSHLSLLKPGLHFKWPWHHVTMIDKRPQLLWANGDTKTPYLSVQTFDKHALEIGYAASYVITDPAVFYQKDKQMALQAKLPNLINQHLSEDLVLLTLPQVLQLNQSQVVSDVLAKSNKALAEDGVKFTSLTMNAVNVAPAEKAQWLLQMQASQNKKLANVSQETTTLSANLRQASDTKVADILAKGRQESAAIRTQGDLDATAIYATAYNKDPQFYEFYHNLQMYKKVLSSKQDVLILSTHTPFFASLSPPAKAEH